MTTAAPGQNWPSFRGAAKSRPELILSCYNARTGEPMYVQRLGGSFTASPVAGDGKLYFASEDGEVLLVKAGPKYRLLATNSMGEVLMATPAISNGLLIVRGMRHVFGIGDKRASPSRSA